MRTSHSKSLDQQTRTEISVAWSPDEVKSALGLVYQAYHREGLIAPNRYEMRVTPFHLLGTTEVLVAKSQGEIACTLTLVRDGKLGLPMESVFGSEVAIRRELGVRCAEATCLADRRANPERSFPLVSKLMSFIIQCAAYRGVDELLIAVHPRHAPFYEKYLGFDLINDVEQRYEAVCDNPAVALSLDIQRLQMSATPAYRRVFGKPFSNDRFHRQPLSANLLAELSTIVQQTYSRTTVESEPREEQLASSVLAFESPAPNYCAPA